MSVKNAALVVLAVIWGVPVSMATLVLQPSDIDTNGVPSYAYSLSFTDMGSTNKFFGDFSAVNLELETGSIRWVNAVEGETTASAIISWDFSGTGYTPTNVVFQDSFSLFQFATERNEAVSSFSVNGTDWTVINAHQTTDGANHSNNSGTSFALNSPSVVYYRFEFSVLPDDADGTFTAVRAQWNRSNQTTFEATFQVIPEPTVSVLYLLGGLALLVRRLRFRHLNA